MRAVHPLKKKQKNIENILHKQKKRQRRKIWICSFFGYSSSCKLISALFSNNNFTTSTYLFLVAQMRAVLPLKKNKNIKNILHKQKTRKRRKNWICSFFGYSSSCKFISALFANNIFTTSTWPFSLAYMRAVSPLKKK